MLISSTTVFKYCLVCWNTLQGPHLQSHQLTTFIGIKTQFQPKPDFFFIFWMFARIYPLGFPRPTHKYTLLSDHLLSVIHLLLCTMCQAHSTPFVKRDHYMITYLAGESFSVQHWHVKWLCAGTKGSGIAVLQGFLNRHTYHHIALCMCSHFFATQNIVC